MTLATPGGGAVPVDAKSTQGDFFTPEAQAFLSNPDTSALLHATIKLADAGSGADYDVIYLAGGHGAVADFPDDADLARLLTQAAAAGKVVAAVCHGVVGLFGAKGPGGRPLLAGARCTGFSDAEEVACGMQPAMPFSVEGRMKALGADYAAGPDWAPHVVVAGKLVTGQNPASSAAVASAAAAAAATPPTPAVEAGGAP